MAPRVTFLMSYAINSERDVNMSCEHGQSEDEKSR